jgi:hypothetical protein
MRDVHVTKRLVDSLKKKGVEYFAWDDQLRGFGVRVRPSGAKSYVVKYQAGSGRGAPTRRMTLGPAGNLTPDEARTLAKRLLGSVAHGKDPAKEKAEERRAATLRELVTAFLAEHAETKRKANTAKHYRSILNNWVLPGTRQPQG